MVKLDGRDDISCGMISRCIRIRGTGLLYTFRDVLHISLVAKASRDCWSLLHVVAQIGHVLGKLPRRGARVAVDHDGGQPVGSVGARVWT